MVTRKSKFVIISVPNGIWDAKGDSFDVFRHHFRPGELVRSLMVKALAQMLITSAKITRLDECHAHKKSAPHIGGRL